MSIYKTKYTVEKALYATFNKEIMVSRNYSATAPAAKAAEALHPTVTPIVAPVLL